MPQLKERTRRDIVDFLSERFSTAHRSEEILKRALPDCDVTRTIDYALEGRFFADHCLKALMNHPPCQDSESPLASLLKVLIITASLSQHDAIRSWIREINTVYNAQIAERVSLDKHVLISYSRADSNLVLKIIRDLRLSNLRISLDRQTIKPGTAAWRDDLRRAINQSYLVVLMASPASASSKHVAAEIGLANSAEIPLLPVWIAGEVWHEAAPFEHVYNQYIDLRGKNYRTGLQDLIYELRKLPDTSLLSEPATESAFAEVLNIDNPEYTSPTEAAREGFLDEEPQNPFVGLRPFTEQNKWQFYGREKLIKQILERFKRDARFHVIVGASGSGKSSLVQAGLIPRLKDNALEGSANWTYLERFSPGNNPMIELRETLFRPLTITRSEIDDDLAQDYAGLSLFAQDISKEKVVLFIDQFEELFIQTKNEELQTPFIEHLVTAAQDPKSNLIIIITMRADFLQATLAHKEFAQLVYDNLIPVIPMSLSELRDAIVKPVEQMRMRYERKLVANILLDVWGEKSQLPLLQFMLHNLFDLRQGFLLTQYGYTVMGGAKEALSNHAEAIFLKLGKRQQTMARAIFLRLIELQDYGTVARRSMPITSLELPKESDTQLIQYVAMYFIDAGLLTGDSQIVSLSDYERLRVFDMPKAMRPSNRITLSHEILTELWDRYAHWIQEHYGDVKHYQRIRRAYEKWRNSEDNTLLLSQELIDIANNLNARYLLSKDEIDYVKDSQKYLKSLENATKKGQQNRKILFVGMTLILLVSVIGLLVIYIRSNTPAGEEAAYIDAQASWMQTRVPNMGGYPLSPSDLTRTPATDFLATATMQANQALRNDVEQTFDDVHMVYVPSGCFWMGSQVLNNGYPIADVTEVCIENDYWIDRYEVTNDQMNNGGELNIPVSEITALDAQAHCQQRGARLPTEAEWEYAARSPNSLAYTWGSNFFEGPYTGIIENFAPVGSVEADRSWVGAYDMAGNISEWTYNGGEDYVLKGGYYFDDNPIIYLLAYRQPLPPEVALARTGFRCVQDETQQ